LTSFVIIGAFTPKKEEQNGWAGLNEERVRDIDNERR
jgi:hypothetical protein